MAPSCRTTAPPLQRHTLRATNTHTYRPPPRRQAARCRMFSPAWLRYRHHSRLYPPYALRSRTFPARHFAPPRFAAPYAARMNARTRRYHLPDGGWAGVCKHGRYKTAAGASHTLHLLLLSRSAPPMVTERRALRVSTAVVRFVEHYQAFCALLTPLRRGPSLRPDRFSVRAWTALAQAFSGR